MSDQNDDDRLLHRDIIAKAQQLISRLESGDVAGARNLISTLNEIREDSLYLELGKLTRELHDTLKSIDVGVAQQDMPNARNRLEYVIQLTEDAANKTMDGIDGTIPLSNSLAQEAAKLLEDWGRLGRKEMKAEEFRDLYKEMMTYLETVQTNAQTIHDNLQEVLVAQDYQDLTGQAIKKVMTVVSDLEKRLVHLVALASEAGKSMGEDIFSEDEEEAEAEEEGSGKVSGQDEVDDLLSSLGF